MPELYWYSWGRITPNRANQLIVIAGEPRFCKGQYASEQQRFRKTAYENICPTQTIENKDAIARELKAG